ncbi:T9SS sorting signal type C domain-containing protein [Litoribaculum gwangyangense]|uniref:T9SS sorting signal type C domain-containing protein n=1 Tax=Litoribaculum gwangyangense TaxID=1130722 RepID=A0ABP9CJW0_9FLAO
MTRTLSINLLSTYRTSFILHIILKKFISTLIYLIWFVFTHNSFGQDLYVGDNSYLYARDAVVFVNNDIRLETDTSHLYFRGNAQLLQNNDIKNSDLGELSIYQNQTTNVYEYNYWCSPVGVSVDGTTQANVDFNGTNIHDPADDADLTNVNSSAYNFTTAYNGTATALSNYWIFTLVSGEGYYSWNQVLDAGSIGTGYGFTMKGSPNPNNVLDFRGRPNNGTIIVSCSFDGVDNQPSGLANHAETLTGNPYPSALDLKLFMAHPDNQINLNGEIYFWEQKQKNSHFLADYEGGYGVYTPGDLMNLSDNGTYSVAAFENYNGDGSDNNNTTGNTIDFSGNNQRRFAAVGQGFVVASNVNGGFATFDNSMRVYFPEDSTPGGDGSIFAKNTNSKGDNGKEKIAPMSHNGIDYKSIVGKPTIIPEIRIHTQINNTYYKENVIAFRESTPNNNTYNKFYDGRNINELASDAYLISSDKDLVIKSINYDETTRLPLGLKAANDNTFFSIKIHRLKNVPSDVNVFVFDKETNAYHDVKNGTYEVTLNKGTYNNRFEVTFAKNNLNVEENTFDNFKVIQNNNLSLLKLINSNNLNIKSVSVFDVSGKRVLSANENSQNGEYQYSTKSLSDGVYIVKIESSNNEGFTKKIMINNKK